MVLSATFVVFPLVLQQILMIVESQHWRTYLPVFALSILLLLPMVIVAEKFKKAQLVFLVAVVMLIVAEAGLALSESYMLAFTMLVLFFGAFNFLEAMLPATVTRIAPVDMKGTAMCLFSSAQFIGAFAGGLLGGVLLGVGDYAMTFAWLALVPGIWFLIALTMKAPEYLSSRIVSLEGLEQEVLEKFVERVADLNGVKEVSIYEIDRVAYHKDLDESVSKFLAIMKSKGATVTEVDQAFRKKWADGMDNVAKIWAARLDSEGKPGTAVLKTYLDTMRNSGATPVRDWDKE